MAGGNDQAGIPKRPRFDAKDGKVVAPAPADADTTLSAEEAIATANGLIDAAAEAAGQRALRQDEETRGADDRPR